MDSKIHLIIFRNVVITLNLLKHCNLYCVHYANERLTLLDKISIKTFQHKITNNLFECLCLVVASFLSFTILNLKFYFCKRSFVGFYLFYLFILYGSQQIKNTVIYIYIYICTILIQHALPVITIMALWQLVPLGATVHGCVQMHQLP